MWKRYWFLIALAVVIPIGLVWPEGGAPIRNGTYVLPILVGTTLFISGFMLETSRLLGQATNLPVILLGLGTTYGVAPLVAYGLARLWGPEVSQPQGQQFVEAVMILAAQAGTLASAIALTTVARGNQELALVLTVATNGLTALFTPLVLQLSMGAAVAFPVGDMMRRLAIAVLLPVLLGQVARRFLWQAAQPVLKALRVIPQLIILVFVYTSFGSASERLSQDSSLLVQFAGACFSLHLFLLAWTYGIATLSRLPHASRTALVFCGSQKTLPNAIYVWSKFFASNPYGAVPMAIYHVFQLVVDTALISWLEPRERAGSDADRRDLR